MIVLVGGYCVKYALLSVSLGYFATVWDILKDDGFFDINSWHVAYGLCVLFGMYALGVAIKFAIELLCSWVWGCTSAEGRGETSSCLTTQREETDDGDGTKNNLWNVANFVVLSIFLFSVLVVGRRVFYGWETGSYFSIVGGNSSESHPFHQNDFKYEMDVIDFLLLSVSIVTSYTVTIIIFK